jgi:hypothetical protein
MLPIIPGSIAVDTLAVARRPALVLLFSLLASSARPAPPAEPPSSAIDALPAAGQTAVFVFARTDCPLSNRYAPELRRLHDAFASDRVRFWLVYPDAAETGPAVEGHTRAFDFGFPALRDPGHALVRRAGATVTPEAAVFVGTGDGARLAYRGRIDDRHVSFGRSRPAPTARDLADVLADLAAGREVPARTTAAVGCAIPPWP